MIRKADVDPNILEVSEFPLHPQRRPGASEASASFRVRHATLLAAIVATRAALKRASAAKHRLQAEIAREDQRDWVVKRRERTRQLIELGVLVAKAKLIELTNDDRAVIFGVLVEAATTLSSEQREQALTLWRRRGKRAFEEASGS